MTRKLLILVLCFLFSLNTAFADDLDDVKTFFNNYVNDANSYKSSVVNYYLPDAKIVRVVIKPDGTKQTVSFPMSRYKRELSLGQKTARLVRYKNSYTERKFDKLDNGDYKISAIRTPSRDDKGLNFYFIATKTADGWKVKEEMMETTVQKFLKAK